MKLRIWSGSARMVRRKVKCSFPEIQRSTRKNCSGYRYHIDVKDSPQKHSYEKIFPVACWPHSVCSDLSLRNESRIQRRIRSVVSSCPKRSAALGSKTGTRLAPPLERNRDKCQRARPHSGRPWRKTAARRTIGARACQPGNGDCPHRYV